MSTREGPRAADRVIDLLELFAADRSSKSLSQLSVALGAPKASLFSLFRTLVKREMLIRDEGGRYMLGPAAMRVAMSVMSTSSLDEITHPVLLKLARKTGETSLVASIEAQSLKAVYIDKAESESAVRYTVPIGMSRDLHCSSVGKLILAYRPDLAARILKVPRLARYTGRTVVDKKALARQLQDIRDAGISKAIDEATCGATGLSAPILNAQGDIVAGLTVAGPTQRMLANLPRIEREIRATAKALSAALPDRSARQIATEIERVARGRA
jgi:DNA-binding IclR family transcriptional regulator